jgi:K+/H+ antiporter YhaU regulatory subunit KhtT
VARVELFETPIPGVGVRYEFTSAAGERLGDVVRRDGRRDLVLYDEKEVAERLEDMWAAKASLMNLGYQYDSLYQNRGTCWIHGTCGAASAGCG